MALASWIFGSLLLFFILGAFIFSPAALPPFKQRLLALISALLAGFFTFFLTGSISIKIEGQASQWGPVAIQGFGGIAVFLLVLWWWQGPVGPARFGRNSAVVPTKSSQKSH